MFNMPTIDLVATGRNISALRSDAGLSVRNLQDIFGFTSFFPENSSSKHVMEKCGMAFSHINEKELTYLDKERDLVYFKIEAGK